MNGKKIFNKHTNTRTTINTSKLCETRGDDNRDVDVIMCSPGWLD